MSEGTKVYVWSDENIETGYTKTAAAMTAALVRAAKEDRLVAMVCTKEGSEDKSTVLCMMTHLADTGNTSCIPMGQVFDDAFMSWQAMTPPACAMPKADE